jgi:GDPmannose 4,6-dehydratase
LAIEFRGDGLNEVGIDTVTGKTIIAVDPRYFRPTEVDVLRGDSAFARTTLGWEPTLDFCSLVEMMVDADLAALRSGKPYTLGGAFEPLYANSGK